MGSGQSLPGSRTGTPFQKSRPGSRQNTPAKDRRGRGGDGVSTTVKRAGSSGERDWVEEVASCRTEGEKAIGGEADDIDAAMNPFSSYITLSSVAADFEKSSRVFAEVIISELPLSHNRKTIKPCRLSKDGSPEGCVYSVHNIEFSIVVSSDEAWKGAANEQKALRAYFSASRADIALPLMCVVDICGYRLHCKSMMPSVKNVVYGMGDKLAVFESSDQSVNEMMASTGKRLNLAPTKVGGGNFQMDMYGPADMLVYKRKRFYATGFLHMFPPEPVGDGPVVRWQRLRPELVRRSTEPLSSNAGETGRWRGDLSGEGGASAAEAEMKAIRSCIRFLRGTVIPSFADWAEEQMQRRIEPPFLKELVAHMQAEGIPCRYLGRVRSSCRTEALRKLFLVEMTARSMKRRLRSMMREAALGTSLDALRDCISSFINGILGTQNAMAVWHDDTKGDLVQLFGKVALTREEARSSASLWTMVDTHGVAMRLLELLGVVLTESATMRLKAYPGTRINITDIQSIKPLLSGLDIGQHGFALRLMEQSALAPPRVREELLEQAVKILTDLRLLNPGSIIILQHAGSAMLSLSTVAGSIRRRVVLRDACEVLLNAFRLNPGSLWCLLRAGDAVFDLVCTQVEEADRLLQTFEEAMVLTGSTAITNEKFLDQCGVWGDRVAAAALGAGRGMWKAMFSLAGTAFSWWCLSPKVDEKLQFLNQFEEKLDLASACICVRGEGWSGSQATSGVRAIDLSVCPLISNTCLKILVDAAGGNLASLSLSGCTMLSGSAVSLCVDERIRRTLTHLDFSHTRFFSTSELADFLKPCVSLTSLNLTDVTALSDRVVENSLLPPEVPDIPNLMPLRGNSQKKDDSYGWTGLTCLYLGDNRSVSDASLIAVAAACTRLVSLDISHCHSISSLGLIDVARKCDSLVKISCNGCSGISDAALIELCLRTRRVWNPNSNYMDHANASAARLPVNTFLDPFPSELGAIPAEPFPVDNAETRPATVSFAPLPATPPRKAAGVDTKGGIGLKDLENEEVPTRDGLSSVGFSADSMITVDDSLAYPLVMDLDEVDMGYVDIVVFIKMARLRKVVRKLIKQPYTELAIRAKYGSLIERTTTVRDSLEPKWSGLRGKGAEVSFPFNPQGDEVILEVVHVDDLGLAIVLGEMTMPVPRYVGAPPAFSWHILTIPKTKETKMASSSSSAEKDAAAMELDGTTSKVTKAKKKNDGLAGQVEMAAVLLGQDEASARKTELQLIAKAANRKKLSKWLSNPFTSNSEETLAMVGRLMTDLEEDVLKWLLDETDVFGESREFHEVDFGTLKVMDDTLCDFFGSFEGLLSINLRSVYQLSDVALVLIAANCPDLACLCVDQCGLITDHGMSTIAASCSSLTELSCSGCEQVSDAPLVEAAEHCCLKILRAGACRLVSDTSMCAVLEKQRLEELSVGGSERVTDATLDVAAAFSCPLRILSVSGCESVEDEGVCAITASCSYLRSLDISFCGRITDRSAQGIAAGLPSLTSLGLAGCALLSDTGMCSIAARCGNLISLCVNLCEMLTDRSADAVGLGLKGLTSLEVMGCSGISNRSLWKLRQRLPLADIVTERNAAVEDSISEGIDLDAKITPNRR